MTGQLFKLNDRTLAILAGEPKPAPVLVPAGSVVKIEQVLDERFVEVEWDGRKVRMFAIDLRERGIPLGD